MQVMSERAIQIAYCNQLDYVRKILVGPPHAAKATRDLHLNQSRKFHDGKPFSLFDVQVTRRFRDGCLRIFTCFGSFGIVDRDYLEQHLLLVYAASGSRLMVERIRQKPTGHPAFCPERTVERTNSRSGTIPLPHGLHQSAVCRDWSAPLDCPA